MKKVLAVCLGAFALAASAYAQATAGLGSVSGTVRDASGAVVPGAAVVVSNEAKGIKRSITTTEAGVAEAPLVENTKTDVSQLVGERQILDLPINGRRVDSFVLLTPAVVPD